MKKETAIDLAKFEEAQKAFESAQATNEQKREEQEEISRIRNQYIEILLDEIETNPRFECTECAGGPAYPSECYYCDTMFCGVSATLHFSVCVAPDLSISLEGISLHCFPLELFNFSINLRKSLQIRLDVAGESRSMFLQYEAPGKN